MYEVGCNTFNQYVYTFIFNFKLLKLLLSAVQLDKVSINQNIMYIGLGCYNNELEECCVKFYLTFSHDNSSDVDVDNLFSELRVLQFTLLTKIMFVIDILKFVKDTDCYPNVSIAESAFACF
jgi:hypothetical protein